MARIFKTSQVGKKTQMSGTFRALMNAHINVTPKDAAICELIDNALPHCQNIWITYDQVNHILSVENDGSPFGKADLQRVFANATYNGDKNDTTISRFGVGLKTAVAALVNPQNDSHCYIVASDGQTKYGIIWDIVALFEMECSEYFRVWDNTNVQIKDDWSGTVIRLTNCYLCNEELETINNEIAIRFSRYIARGKKIFLNGSLVEPYDPMYVDDISDVYTRRGFNIYWRNNKAFMINNVSAVNQNDPDDVIDVGILGLYIPEGAFDANVREYSIHKKELNSQMQGGIAVAYNNRYVTVPSNNTNLIGRPNNNAGAARKRLSIELNRRNAGVFKLNHTKNRGIMPIKGNLDLTQYKVTRPDGSKVHLHIYIDQLWKWVNNAYDYCDRYKKELCDITEDNLRDATIPFSRPTKTSTTCRRRTLPPQGCFDMSSVLNDKTITTTQSHLEELLTSNGVRSNIIERIIANLLNS